MTAGVRHVEIERLFVHEYRSPERSACQRYTFRRHADAVGEQLAQCRSKRREAQRVAYTMERLRTGKLVLR
jgi:hypothetical protein